MKFLKGFLATLLILVILGGIGYIVYSQFFMGGMNHFGMNTAPNNMAAASPTPAPQAGNQHGAVHGMPATNMQNTVGFSAVAGQNRDKLNQAIGTINQALDLISIDPYSKITLPTDSSMNIGSVQGQASNQGSGIVNIYPNGNTSVTITPNGTVVNPDSIPARNNQNNTVTGKTQFYVYDQSKLQQFHNGIYSLAQGIALLNQLNDDLLAQTALIEGEMSNIQTHMLRYNLSAQNKAKLTNAIALLNQASTLINVNPYGSANGYPYNPDAMSQLHQGVFKLAQADAMLDSLNDGFTSQMVQAAAQVQNLASLTYQNASTTGHSMGLSLFQNINIATVFNLILILMVAGLIAGILGAILSVFRRKPQSYEADYGNGTGQ